MKTITVSNIFSEGVLVDLRISLWSGTGKLGSDKYNINDEKIDKDRQIRVSMDLLDDMSILKAMRKIKGRAVHYLSLKSMIYPGNLDFISKDIIEEVDKKLSKFQNKFEKLRDEFATQLKKLEKDFAKNHPSIYDASKYPSEELIKSRFQFTYVFRAFEPPQKDVLPSTIYKKEFNKFKQDLDKMKEEATEAVSNEIVKRLKALNEQIKDEDKNIHKGTLNAVNKMIEKFDNLWSGFIDDKVISKTLKEMKSTIKNINIEDNKRDGFKNEIKSLVDNATKNLKKSTTFRAIQL